MIKRDQYESIAECIRGDQVSAPEVVELFEDGKFLKWYKRKYNIDDMVKGDVIFCATGVTSGDLAKGVLDLGNEFEVNTFILHKSKKIISE